MERKEKIEKLKEGIKAKGKNKQEKYNRINAIRLLMIYLSQEVEGEREEILNGFIEDERIEDLDNTARMLIEEGTKFIEEYDDKDVIIRVAGYIKEGYQVLARRDFEKFLIAIEWNYSSDMKFYDIRKNVLKEWAKNLQKLEYGEVMGESISAPPRVGKSRNSEKNFLYGVC